MKMKLYGVNRGKKQHSIYMIINTKRERRERRHKRIRAKVFGTSVRPRLSIFKSNTRIIAQIIDDEASKTLVAISSSNSDKKTMKERAIDSGKKIAKIAGKKKIKEVIFDRGGFTYTGNIKAFADGAREEGLIF